MSSKFWTELSSDYEKLFEAETGYDVAIYAGEEPNNVKEFMLIQTFCALGLNIFVVHFLMNGLRKKMESIFSENLISRLTYLILFSGNAQF